MLPQLSLSGATNVLLVADGRMATMALSDGSAQPEALGREYVLHSPPVANGIFHPKIIVQVGREGGRCFVNSANVTGAGLGGNVEVAVEVECGVEPCAEREIVQAAWRYIEASVPNDGGAAREAISWARARAQWLDEPSNGDEVHGLEDGTAIAFLGRPGGFGIGARFAGLIGGDAVERLVIVSPYWDAGLEATTALELALNPVRTSLLLDVKRHEFPTGVPMPANRDIIDISSWRSSQFTHAKIVIAITKEHDHVLSGSANCTIGALGGEGSAGYNAEACVYRRLPRGAATAALAMDDWLAAEPFPIAGLCNPVKFTPIPLETLQAGGAGSFEVEGGRLNWHRAVGRWSEGTVVLTQSSDEVIAEIDVAHFTAHDDRLSVWVGEGALDQASFAHVQFGDVKSLPSYVVHRAALRSRRRESVGGGVAKALSAFDDGSEMQLRMLQAFDELARADVVDDGEQSGAVRGARAQRAAEVAVPLVRYMTYEEFMSARSTRRGRGGRSDSTVAGTHFDSVRALLNRLSGGEQPSSGEPRSQDANSWMDLGDEAGDLEDADATPPFQETDHPRVRPPPDMAAYDRAIKIYTDGLTAEDRSIGARDVLRLRLWMMLILWEAKCVAAPKGMPAVADEKGWPRLVVRVVSAFFWGKNSPISRLIVSTDYDDMPVDFMECWSTVLWALDAIVTLVPQQPRTRDFLRRVPTLRAHIVKALGLTLADFETELMTKQRQRLDAELGARLFIGTSGLA